MLLQLEGVNAGYGRVAVLHDVTMHVDNGDLLAVIGPNGAGKSTLLSTIAGLLPVMSGQIRFAGQPIDGLFPSELVARGVGLMPQEGNVFPDLTVRENLEIAASSRARASAAVEGTLAHFAALKERHGQLAGTLSGGERQMLAIASVLLLDTDLLLLDEPTTGLAPKIRRQLTEQIRRTRAAGKTVVWVVEENPRQILQEANRVYLLDSGAIRAERGGRELARDPRLAELFLGYEGADA